jgi:GTPase SAR1 family protein
MEERNRIKICVVGPSASGKTSVVNFLTGFEQPDEYEETWGLRVCV